MRLDRRSRSARQLPLLNTPAERTAPPLPLWRKAAVWPLATLVRLWWRTVTFEVPDEDLRIVTAMGRATVWILWHNRLFLAAEFIRRYRNGHPLYSLISASRDGSWLAALFSALGLPAVRGSSSRLGREAAGELIEMLNLGFDAGVTPDGPRGPMYSVKPGALVVARRARARACLIGVDFESAWRLSSWDGFYIPRPFSSVRLRFVELGPEDLEEGDEAAARLARRLAEINPDRRPAPLRKPASA